MMSNGLSVRYDQGSDVLYFSLAEPCSAYGEELDLPGIYLRLRDTDDQPVGAIITDFKANWLDHHSDIVAAISDRLAVSPTRLEKALGAHLLTPPPSDHRRP